MSRVNTLLNNPELPENLRGIVADIGVYISVLETHRAELLDAVKEADLTGLVSSDIMFRVHAGEFDNV